MRETKLYRISKMFAKREDIPVFVVAQELVRTQKAVYLYGHGSMEANQTGRCPICGLTLTHPVSVALGIGPICGGHMHDWNAVEAKSKEDVARIKAKLVEFVHEKRVDSWIPLACIKEESPTNETVDVPPDHKMLNPKGRDSNQKRTAVLDGKRIKIQFPYNETDVKQVRTLPDRKWNGEDKFWHCPLTIEATEKLKEWDFELSESLIEFLDGAKLNVDDCEIVEVPDLKKELYPFQKRGVGFITKRNGRALIGDEMGLGKTVQSLGYLALHPEDRPVVIVVPATLKYNWRNEYRDWMKSDDSIQILSGRKPQAITGDIIIINYDILTNEYEQIEELNKKGKLVKKRGKEIPHTGWVDYLCDIQPQILILDECHFLKDSKALRTIAVKKLAEAIPKLICLSGTPIVNRPEEFYNAISLIDESVIPGWFLYHKRYCGMVHTRFGWDKSGATHTEELHDILVNTIMLRRLKKDVLPQLPPKQRTILPMELDNIKEYRHAEDEFIDWLTQEKGEAAARKASNAEALARIEALKQLSVKGKLKQAMEWVENFLDSNGKLVVFCTHRATVDTLMDKFGERAVRVDGSVTGEARQHAVDRFQDDPSIRLFVGNIKAAGLGITLTAASDVAFLELGWSPGEHDQAEDRVHRIGQEAESINIYYLLAEGTIETEIAQLIDKKRQVLDMVLDGKETETTSMLSELLSVYRKGD